MILTCVTCSRSSTSDPIKCGYNLENDDGARGTPESEGYEAMSSAEQRMLRISLWCLVATLIVWTGTAGAGITATRVLGQPDFTHNATNTLSAGSLNFPGNHGSGAVVVDEINDHVYVAETIACSDGSRLAHSLPANSPTL